MVTYISMMSIWYDDEFHQLKKKISFVCFVILQQTYKMKLRKQFEGHSFGIGCIAWCPFSRYIIACGTDECNEIWIWDVEVSSEEKQFRVICGGD